MGIDTERPTDIYNIHNESVCRYFEGQYTRFRVLNWEGGHGWQELTDFIGVAATYDIPFPQENAS